MRVFENRSLDAAAKVEKIFGAPKVVPRAVDLARSKALLVLLSSIEDAVRTRTLIRDRVRTQTIDRRRAPTIPPFLSLSSGRKRKQLYCF